MQKKLITYLKDKKGKKYGVVVFTALDKVGYSICRKEDTFSKKRGVEIATGRALTGKYTFKILPVIFSKYPKMKAIQKLALSMLDKAARYFG
jgi:hypothetical protein